jgi:site-specific DNA-methyltransferase (adenine-specific)
MTYQILHGNNLDILPTLADNSIDSIVTDPPYELGFMGKRWDSSGIAYSVELWQQCLRVLKPGGHLLAFSGSRTYHRMVVAIEDAGFEIRDMISWISNKTFPKSLNIGKAIDKAAGAEREVIGKHSAPAGKSAVMTGSRSVTEAGFWARGDTDVDITAPATDEAKQWDGWGTGLKPTVEPIVMARKPVEGTIANNVLTYGTGGLNIDGSRIRMTAEDEKKSYNNWKPEGYEAKENIYDIGNKIIASEQNSQGRWPANLILDEDTAELLDEQSGITKGKPGMTNLGKFSFTVGEKVEGVKHGSQKGLGDTGGASRFFYVAKASKRDRNEGLEELGESVAGSYSGNVANKGNKIGAQPDKPNQPAKNFHPTVKPTSLMEYLIKLVTPPGGVVLDPFTGSGSTGKAAILQGFDFIGIEMTEEYLPIIEGRLKHAEAKVAERIKETSDKQSEVLF